MALKLLYLPMDWERFHQLHASDHVRSVIRGLKISMMVLLTKIVNNVNLKTPTILAKD